jgi:hypothetical protein
MIVALMLYWMCGVGIEHWAQPDEQRVSRGAGCREPKGFGAEKSKSKQTCDLNGEGGPKEGVGLH